MGLIGFELTCQVCINIFYICKRHYRGHRYCSELCRKKGYKTNRQKAGRKYEQTQKGKRSNAKRQATYRDRQNSTSLFPAFLKVKTNKVTDQCSLFNKGGLNPVLRRVSRSIGKKICSICSEEIEAVMRIYERNKGKTNWMG